MHLHSLRILALLFPLALVATLAGCGDSAAKVADARTAAGTVNGLCPVREELVVPGVFLEHDGQKIGFCCAPCKTQFQVDPEGFLKTMRADREKFGYVGK